MSSLTSTAIGGLFLFAAATAPVRAADASVAQPQLPRLDFSSCARPVYPRADIAANHTGTVTLQFLVNQDGSVADSRVTRSSGHASLDDAARTALAQCRFNVPEGYPMGAGQVWVPIQYVWTVN
jgi:TonB family protein